MLELAAADLGLGDDVAAPALRVLLEPPDAPKIALGDDAAAPDSDSDEEKAALNEIILELTAAKSWLDDMSTDGDLVTIAVGCAASNDEAVAELDWRANDEDCDVAAARNDEVVIEDTSLTDEKATAADRIDGEAAPLSADLLGLGD